MQKAWMVLMLSLAMNNESPLEADWQSNIVDCAAGHVEFAMLCCCETPYGQCCVDVAACGDLLPGCDCLTRS